jgi:hypothetical protein
MHRINSLPNSVAECLSLQVPHQRAERFQNQWILGFVLGAGAMHACYILFCRKQMLTRNFHRVWGQPYHYIMWDSIDDLTSALQADMVTEN